MKPNTAPLWSEDNGYLRVIDVSTYERYAPYLT